MNAGIRYTELMREHQSTERALSVLFEEGFDILEVLKAVRKHEECSLGEAKLKVERHHAWARLAEKAKPIRDELETAFGFNRNESDRSKK
ncbi:MAG: hypothetical protein AAF437_04070 [Pseudomonadota bacterium]